MSGVKVFFRIESNKCVGDTWDLKGSSGERFGGVRAYQVVGGFGADVELVVVAQAAGEDVCG